MCERWSRRWSQYCNQIVKKFRSGCEKVYDQAGSGKPQTMDCEAVIQVVEGNPESSTGRVSASHSPVIFTTSSKVSGTVEISKVLQNVWLNLV